VTWLGQPAWQATVARFTPRSHPVVSPPAITLQCDPCSKQQQPGARHDTDSLLKIHDHELQQSNAQCTNAADSQDGTGQLLQACKKGLVPQACNAGCRGHASNQFTVGGLQGLQGLTTTMAESNTRHNGSNPHQEVRGAALRSSCIPLREQKQVHIATHTQLGTPQD
jgi:hypothetical protein